MESHDCLFLEKLDIQITDLGSQKLIVIFTIGSGIRAHVLWGRRVLYAWPWASLRPAVTKYADGVTTEARGLAHPAG